MASKVTNGVTKSVWVGRIVSTIIVLLLILDGVVKLMKPAPVIEAFTKLGYNPYVAFGMGILLLTCTILYAIPRTAILGAILLTGYLGGATATHVRVEDPLFSVLFPGILGIVIWGGLYLRDERVRALMPLRQTPKPQSELTKAVQLALQN